MDARNSMSMLSRLMNYWIVQTRKRNVDLIIATHEFIRLDKRVRQAVNMRFGCKFNKRGLQEAFVYKKGVLQRNSDTNEPIRAKDQNGDPIFIKTVIDKETGKRSVVRARPTLRLLIRNLDAGKVDVKLINPLPVMKLFDTTEVVDVPTQVMAKTG